MGDVVADQATLVLNHFCSRLQNNLISGRAVTWKEMDGELDDRNALKVSEQVGPRYTISETTDGVKDLSSGTDDTVFGNEEFTVNKTFNANMGWGDFLKIKTFGDARESEALNGAALSMAEYVDAYVFSVAWKASQHWTGTIGNTISDHVDFVAGYQRLKEEGVLDMDLFGIMRHAEETTLGDQVVNLPAPSGMAETAFRQGFRGKISGIDTAFTNQLPVLTVGSRTAAATTQVNGANQNVDYSSVANSTSPGQFKTQTINLNNMTSGHTIVAGETLHFAGVYAYDNRKQALVSPARLQQFTVVTGGTADGSGEVTIRIYPAIIVPGSGSGGDINVNTAHATVDAAPANGAVVTHNGTASTSYGGGMIIQKPAIVVNTVPLIMPASDTAARKKLKRVPITVRMWRHSDFKTGEHGVRFDVALTANVRHRERIVRVNGS